MFQLENFLEMMKCLNKKLHLNSEYENDQIVSITSFGDWISWELVVDKYC